MSSADLNQVAVVSSAQTELRESWSGVQHVDLIFAAVTDALRGTGLGISDVDVVIDCGSDVLDGRSISNCGFLGAMGAHHKEESRVEEDGLWGAAYAMNKIAAGEAKVALVVAYSKPSESDVRAYYTSITEPFYQRPVGLDQFAAAGLMANQYLSATGLGEDVLLDVAAHDWARAAANTWVHTPEAVDRAALTAAELVAQPLRRPQVARPLDGAVAVVLAEEQVARRTCDRPVWLTGAGSAIDAHLFAERTPGRLDACAVAAATAYRRAGVTDPASFDIAEVSADSAAGELMILEALGLAEQGKANALYTESSPVSVNPSGGALPADPIMATGLVRLSEAAFQLSGRVDRGSAGARSAVVHGSGGLAMQNHCVFTLEV
ncbi:MAG: thiolase C-terminal domain-containing protein [Pseudonocardiaceae bacterium]